MLIFCKSFSHFLHNITHFTSCLARLIAQGFAQRFPDEVIREMYPQYLLLGLCQMDRERVESQAGFQSPRGSVGRFTALEESHGMLVVLVLCLHVLKRDKILGDERIHGAGGRGLLLLHGRLRVVNGCCPSQSPLPRADMTACTRAYMVDKPRPKLDLTSMV